MKELISLSNSIFLEVNAYKDNYETIEDYCTESSIFNPDYDEYVNSEDYLKSIELDTLIELTVYPHTPIGSYTVIGYDYNKVVEEMLSILKK